MTTKPARHMPSETLVVETEMAICPRCFTPCVGMRAGVDPDGTQWRVEQCVSCNTQYRVIRKKREAE